MNSFEENVLQEAGWGCYQKFLIGLSSIYLFCNGFAYLNMPSILPIAKCDLLMSESDIIWIQSINYLGMLLGGWFIGTVTDVVERIRLISVSYIITFVCSFIIGFATEIYLLSCCAFLTGVGIAAGFSTVKINLAEQLPIKNRGMCIVFGDMFWILGYLVATGIGYVLLPNIRNPVTNHPKQTWNFISWRIMAGFVAGLCLMASFTTALLQPNVRSLLSKRRKTTAHTFLKFIYAINNSDHAEKYKRSVRQIQGYIKEFPVRESNITGCMPLCMLRTRRSKVVYKTIFKIEHFKSIALVTILRSFLFGGLYTCNLLLARNLTKHVPVEQCNISNFELTFLKTGPCAERIYYDFYINFVLLALCSLVVILFLTFLIDRVGRRILLILAYLCCAACSLMLAFFYSYLVTLILTIFFFMGFIAINFTLDVVILESVPTYTRGTAFGISYILQFLLNLSLKFFTQIPLQITFIIIGTFMFAGSVLSYFLPDLKQKPMVE